VRFHQTKKENGETETEIFGRIEGLTPDSKHAFHIHELGDLTDDENGCDSLASHFNPFGEHHGGPGSCHSHMGDLGNI
jgi:superoxide dismutase, Cu-Zn family